MSIIKTFALLLLIAITSGCTYTTKASLNSSYHLDVPKIKKSVSLQIPEDTLSQVSESHYLWDTYQVPIGLILEQNAPAAFKTIFTNVASNKAQKKSDWLITLTAKPETKINLGMFTFSSQTYTTALQCDITSPSGKVVWTKTITTEASGRRALEAVTTAASPLAGAVLNECGFNSYTCALQDAANESTARALGQLIDEIYQAKAQIFAQR